MLFKLAWRNIWRNRTRTIITLAAVFLAVIMSTMMSSMKEGMYENMIKATVDNYMGYGQLHSADYVDEEIMDNSMVLNDELVAYLNEHPDLDGFSPRIQTGGLAYKDDSSGVLSRSKKVGIVGIDPDKEEEFIHMNERVVEGEYLTKNDREILVGAGLAERLKLKVGDSLIFIGVPGYYGTTAINMCRIKGIVKFGSPEISKRMVFMSLKETQRMTNMDSLCTYAVLNFKDSDKAEEVVDQIGIDLGKEYTVRDWQELNPDLLKMIETDRVEGYVFMFILYFVIALGLFSTMLMMVSERKREFGVLIGVGMKRAKLAVVVWLEMISISFLGALIGMGLAFPICANFHYNPIPLPQETQDMMEEYGIEAVMQFSIDPTIFITQAIVVFIISSLIAIYPFVKLLGLNAQNAMRS